MAEAQEAVGAQRKHQRESGRAFWRKMNKIQFPFYSKQKPSSLKHPYTTILSTHTLPLQFLFLSLYLPFAHPTLPSLASWVLLKHTGSCHRVFVLTILFTCNVSRYPLVQFSHLFQIVLESHLLNEPTLTSDLILHPVC